MKSDLTSYKYTVDTEHAHLYAKPSCKKCYGKGYITNQYSVNGTIRYSEGQDIRESNYYCSCVQ